MLAFGLAGAASRDEYCSRTGCGNVHSWSGSVRPANYGRPRVHLLAGLLYCGSCGGPLVTYLQPRQTRGSAAGRTRTPTVTRVRIASPPLEAFIEGYVIEMWRNPTAREIAESDDDRMERITNIRDEMAQIQRQKNEGLKMRLRNEVDLKTYRAVTRELDEALNQLDREHKSLTCEVAMPELPDPSLAWEDLPAVDRRALTEMLVDKIVIYPHPHVMDAAGSRHYTIRAIPYPRPRAGGGTAQGGARGQSRSSPGSEQRRRADRSFDLSVSSRLTS
jgi:hypothetical protein